MIAYSFNGGKMQVNDSICPGKDWKEVRRRFSRCLKKKKEDEEVKAEEKNVEEEERKECANNILSTNYVPDPAVSTLLKLILIFM